MPDDDDEAYELDTPENVRKLAERLDAWAATMPSKVAANCRGFTDGVRRVADEMEARNA